MQITNKHRAGRCGKLLRTYDPNDLEESCLIDFLADARHYCDRKKLSFADLDRQAYRHYVCELHEERGGTK